MLHRQLALFDDRPGSDPGSSFAEQIAAFTYEGKRTETLMKGGIPYFFNEFWTARQRQGHALHEVSYRACFKPQLPGFFIDRLTRPGDTVYDPFMGRGTTPVQAALMGRNALGNDINPLSAYFTRPRLAPPSMIGVLDRLGEINWEAEVETPLELKVFYHPETLQEICALRAYLSAREAAGTADPVDDWIRMVAINRLTGHSPGFFSVYSLPPNQAVSVAAQRKINEKRNQVPPRRVVPDIIAKKSHGLLKDGVPPGNLDFRLFVGPAECTPHINTASVDLVVTSPPFLDIVQYSNDNWLRCWFVGTNFETVPISMHKKPDDWTAFTRRIFLELQRIVRPGGHVAYEVGEVRNGKVELDRLVLEAIDGLQFEPLAVVVNVQEFTKTANCWGINNNAKGTNTNRIIVARRHG